MTTNPYVEDPAPFFGREQELELLTRDLTRGGSALGAVMGGRGMGKTAFARVLEDRLLMHPECEVHRWPHTPSVAGDFLLKLGRSLSYDFTGRIFDEEVRDAIRARRTRRVIMILDEVDDLIESPSGRGFLENIRIAWEQLRGRLGFVILGGSSLYELLETNVSPYLRNAQFVNLRGLSRVETARLVREPCKLDVPEEEVELLWEETAGHPAMVTEIMRTFVDRGLDLERGILSVVDRELVGQLEHRFFSIWWKNLRPRGQEVYRRLLEHGRPVEEGSVSALVGRASGQWVHVLETTGVLRVEGGELLARGELFGRWARREQFHATEPALVVPEHVERLGGAIGAFEKKLLMAVSRWAHGVLKYAALGLSLKASHGAQGNGNARLMPEAHFQAFLLLALQQNGWVVNAEAWSVAGRSDLEVVSPDDGARACIELKIWGRNDYLDVVEQALGYALPSDSAACVVMLDRATRPLVPEYRAKVVQTRGYAVIGEAADVATTMPQLVTEHPRPGAAPLRVHHFLLQLPSD